MAGHSKWANIKRRKESQDAKKTKVYSRILREITAAVKLGNSEDPTKNARLRLAIQNAKAANIPKDNIERAVKKGGGQHEEHYLEVQYEGYGPGGVAILVEGMTNNLNRTVANIRAIFNKYGGSLAKKGSIDHLFDHQGYFMINQKTLKLAVEELSLAWIESGVEDIIEEKEWLTLLTSFHNFGNVQTKLEEQEIAVHKAYTLYTAHSMTMLQKRHQEKTKQLLQALEDDDDIQHVYHNLSEEID
ncbi:MAG: YebC/PmpR family DNA-binding transcriptional regulator [Bacteroidota bacterium]